MMDFYASWAPSVHLKALPSESREDVFALFPKWFREGENALRDSVAHAIMMMMVRIASDFAALAASCNPAYAEGDLLDAVLAPIPRALNESDYGYRRRALKSGLSISPKEILDAVYSITSRFSSTYPEYFEFIEDEPFLFAHDDNNFNGFYFHDTAPIDDDTRFYAIRGNCKPRHAFWRGEYRDPANTRLRLSWVGDDYIDVFAEAKAMIVLPPFPVPGNDLDSDMFLFETSDSSSVDAHGEAMYDLTTLGTYPDAGGHVFASNQDVTQVVAEVQALLAASGAFPSGCEIMLDPNLTF